jgi:hypothetical protein
LTAYLTDTETDVVIRPNDVRRGWVSDETGGNGYRCVPLNMASSLGWSFLTPFTLTIIYDGERLGISAKDKRIDATRLVTDQFGSGIFTFYVALVFRSPPGHNLFVTGPLNEPRRGATALSAIVETDWAEVNFTMNWKITEPNYPVTFRRGEPFCTFFPYPRGYAEKFVPQFRAMAQIPDVQARHERWLFNRLTTDSMDGNYARGEHFVDAGRGPFKDHQRRIRMPKFRRSAGKRAKATKNGD